MDNPNLCSQLENIVGTKNILTDDDSKILYGKDRTQNYTPNPYAIVFPQNETQVLSIVEWANKTKTPLVPSGGRTGYSGGAVALNQEVVVAFDKMNRILEYNAEEQTVRCQPGVITKDLQNFALKNNLYYPVGFASSGSSQIGGNIATNAGGIRVIRYGLTRNWIDGLNVITGNGDLLQLNKGLIKNACGYDLRHLFIGSEGTLGFITEAIIKLTIPPKETKVVLFTIPEKQYLLELLPIFRGYLSITAFEFFSDAALTHVIRHFTLPHPFEKMSPYYILLEYESNQISDDFVLGQTESSIRKHLINDAIISQHLKQYIELWALRENISMTLAQYFPYKYDISVPPIKIPRFIEDVDAFFNKNHPDFNIIWFGHIGDGNLHLNILKPDDMSPVNFFNQCDEASTFVYSLIEHYHGSISAEHGIGLLKKKFLHYTKNEKEIEYMYSIKKIFDRNNIMNPGKIFDTHMPFTQPFAS
ncbi:MAG: FAD-binding oxidoreductase [Gammaproteobacteria bacterium]